MGSETINLLHCLTEENIFVLFSCLFVGDRLSCMHCVSHHSRLSNNYEERENEKGRVRFSPSLTRTWFQTRSNPHPLIHVKWPQRAACWHGEQSGDGLDKNTLFGKTVSSQPLGLAVLRFILCLMQIVPKTENRTRGGERGKRSGASERESVKKQSAVECFASCRPLIMALG